MQDSACRKVRIVTISRRILVAANEVPLDGSGKVRIIDIKGQRFGRLIAIDGSRRTENKKRVLWECLCDCGNVIYVQSATLRKGITQSCGCFRKEVTSSRCKGPDISGQRFGRLTAIREDGRSNKSSVIWFCICDCGESRLVSRCTLESGHTRSCGCLRSDLLIEVWSTRMPPYQHILNRARDGAIKRGFEFDLSLEFYQSLVGKDCHYCSLPLLWNARRKDKQKGRSAHNLDRKDSSLGYTESNVVPCCGTCNWIKSDVVSYDEMIWIGQARQAYRESRQNMPLLKVI